MFRRPLSTFFVALACALLTLTANAADWRNVTDAVGEDVKMPAQSQRVVALSELDLDAALALGVQPVATLKGRGQDTAPHYLGERAADIAIIGNFMQPSLGKLIEIKPDLILAGGIPDSRLVERLRAIAPTVVTYERGAEWKGSFRSVADILNRLPQFEQFMADYQARIEQLQVAIPNHADTTVSIVRWNPRGPSYMLRDSFSSLVIRDLGFKRPETQREPGAAHSPSLSLEALHLLDADWMFVGTLRGEGQAAQAMAEVRKLPAFDALAAARNDHVVVVDGSLWTSSGGPLAAMAILENVADAMTDR